MFDPQFISSLSSIALSDDGLEFYHKIPVDLLLSAEEQKSIETNQLDYLPQIFHNLSAEPSEQKVSFKYGKVMLNSWELLCLILNKHIQGLQNQESFYNTDDMGQQENECTRIDDTRLALVVLVKLFEYV